MLHATHEPNNTEKQPQVDGQADRELLKRDVAVPVESGSFLSRSPLPVYFTLHHKSAGVLLRHQQAHGRVGNNVWGIFADPWISLFKFLFETVLIHSGVENIGAILQNSTGNEA